MWTANHGIQRQQREAEEQPGFAKWSTMFWAARAPWPGLALIRGQLRLAQFSRNQELESDATASEPLAGPQG